MGNMYNGLSSRLKEVEERPMNSGLSGPKGEPGAMVNIVVANIKI